jgi:hypothetical protein
MRMIYPGCGENLDVRLIVLPGQGGDLDLLRAQFGHVQSFTENLKIYVVNRRIYF